MKMKKESLINNLFLLSVFVYFLLFFCIIHPLIPFDGDDWATIFIHKSILIDITDWNPTRILPQFLMPVIGDVAGFIVYPICNDYIQAHTIAHAAVVSFFILLYTFSFQRFILIRYKRSVYESIVYSIFFLFLHFLIFRIANTDNQHLFYSQDLTCYYYYIIPNMLCGSLVLSLLTDDWLQRMHTFSLVKQGIILIILYLAVCSNLFCSAILILFLSGRLFVNYPWKKKTLSSIKDFIIRYKYDIIIIIFWIFVCFCETLGGRAHSIDAQDAPFEVQLLTVFRHFLLVRFNYLFLFLLSISILLFLFSFIRKKNTNKISLILLIDACLSFCFAIIINTRVFAHYVQRSDVMFSVFFPMVVFIVVSVVMIQMKYGKVMTIMPFFILIIFTNIKQSHDTFRDLSIGQLTGNYPLSLYEITQIEKDFVQQIIQTEKTNIPDSIIIEVPDCGKDYIWPWTNWGLDCLTGSMQRHKVIGQSHPGRFIITNNKKPVVRRKKISDL